MNFTQLGLLIWEEQSLWWASCSAAVVSEGQASVWSDTSALGEGFLTCLRCDGPKSQKSSGLQPEDG